MGHYFTCKGGSAIIIACNPYNNNDRKKKKRDQIKKIRQFSYADLESATAGFSPANFLGKGSHGIVYKAIIDDGNSVVATKKTNSSPSADNEIEILSKIRSHRLVNLLGYTLNNSNEKKLIVVEFMPNGSLYDLLHSNPRPPGWTKRIRFALQTAKAVQTLHSSNPPVIHRDIKSSNVLLDQNWNARLGDFGLALMGHVEDVKMRSTPPAGTLGYLDPGYVSPENLSTKSDVFSFGILLLEIISGRNAIDLNYSPPSVIDWALPLVRQEEFTQLYDPRIERPKDPVVVRELPAVAASCVGWRAEKRPSMAEVVDRLRVVGKRVASPLWSNFRRVANKPSPSIVQPGIHSEVEVSGTVKELCARSKSFGSGREMRVGSDSDLVVNEKSWFGCENGFCMIEQMEVHGGIGNGEMGQDLLRV